MEKDAIFEIIKKNTVAILPDVSASDIRMSESLKNYGANSIDRMDIVIQSMEDVGITIPMMELGGVKNIEGLVDIFYRAQQK